MTIAKGSGLVRPAGLGAVWLGADRVWPPTGGGSPPPPPPPPPRSAPVLRSSSQDYGSGAVGRPAGVVSGDLLIGYFFDFVASGVITIPSGWTAIGPQQSGTSLEIRTAYKVAGGSEPSTYGYSSSAPDFPSAFIAAYSSYDTGEPIGASAQNAGSGTTRTIPDVTAPYENSELLVFTGSGVSTYSAAPAGMTLVQDLASGSQLSIFRQAIAAAGATGARTQTQASGGWVTNSVLINGPVI